MDTASSQTKGETGTASQLPPEAVALASRMFDATRKGDEDSVALLTQALGRGLPANLTNDKGDTLVSSWQVLGWFSSFLWTRNVVSPVTCSANGSPKKLVRILSA